MDAPPQLLAFRSIAGIATCHVLISRRHDVFHSVHKPLMHRCVNMRIRKFHVRSQKKSEWEFFVSWKNDMLSSLQKTFLNKVFKYNTRTANNWLRSLHTQTDDACWQSVDPIDRVPICIHLSETSQSGRRCDCWPFNQEHYVIDVPSVNFHVHLFRFWLEGVHFPPTAKGHSTPYLAGI